MIYLNCDYNEGCHPRLLQKLAETNLEQTEGYGEDPYCAEAAGFIKKLCGDETLLVRFLVGGTQANTTVIAAMLRPQQGVLSADTGHVSSHESGAIEATGHKVLTLPGTDGKIAPAQAEAYCRAHFEDPIRIHTVQPGMIYLSNPTEYGTLYSRAELTAFRRVCDEYNLMLYVDGARMGYGLASPANDLTLADYARLCDAFCIGGTKVGALFGEAVVIRNDSLKDAFPYLIKQHGGLLAKGRLLGVQFGELFRDGLYLELGRHADEMAARIAAACRARGWGMFVDSPTNQIFPVIPDVSLAALSRSYEFAYWHKSDESHTAVRVCASWATPEAVVAGLEKAVAAC